MRVEIAAIWDTRRTRFRAVMGRGLGRRPYNRSKLSGDNAMSDDAREASSRVQVRMVGTNVPVPRRQVGSNPKHIRSLMVGCGQGRQHPQF